VAKNKKFIDPYLEREQKRYQKPIPSRESILDYLEEVGRPVSFKHLLRKLSIKEEDQIEALSFRLKAMCRDGQLMQDRRDRFCILKRLALIRGTVSAHRDGFGFLIPDDGSKDLYLSASEMRQAMHGDTVLAYELPQTKKRKREARIHEVLEHANTRMVGKIEKRNGIYFFEPHSKHFNQAMMISESDCNGAVSGQVVVAEIGAYPNKRHPGVVKVVEVLGHDKAPLLETQMVIFSHNIPCEWPQEVLGEVAKLRTEVTAEDRAGSKDLRNDDFVTIDGETARDFDDAIFCQERSGGSFQLKVAIADVSYYVKPGSALDKEALNRATSVYFPTMVVPMLPEALSNGLCSLNPHVDRLTVVCDMTFSADGRMTRSRFYRAVIHSKARLTYTEVAKVMDGAPYPDGMPNLDAAFKLYHVLHKARIARGAMSFESSETQIVFDENKKIKEFLPLKRNDAHCLIEECMLAANVAAARLVKRHKIPSLYRVHLPPSEEKITNLREFLAGFALKLGGGKKPHPKDYCKLLQSIEERPEKPLIEMVMLRSLTQAQYVEKNEGHFGLAYNEYTHFTSPIRRYPDLMTHRAILHSLTHQDEAFMYDEKTVSEIGAQCSRNERRADEASREVMAWLKCEYMQDKLGKEYDGHISGVTNFGVFVTLDDIFVDGLVHMTSLADDYYQFDSVRHRLIGENTRKTYRLGDKLRVKVVRVDLDARKMDFELCP
jgi:ribonuclease R